MFQSKIFLIFLTHLLFILQICLLVEIGEQEVEHNGMSANKVSKTNWIVAIILEEQLEGVYHYQNKLNHLQNSQIFLPPQIFLYFWAHGGKHIIGVHKNVYESVQESKEGRMTARCKLNTPPDRNWHDAMMNDMQCRDLIITFAHHKEEGIEEFGEFGKEVPPAATSRLKN